MRHLPANWIHLYTQCYSGAHYCRRVYTTCVYRLHCTLANAILGTVMYIVYIQVLYIII